MTGTKTLTWGCSLALGGLLFCALASQAPAQTPPNEPSDFSAWFVMVRIPATGAGPVGDGTMFPGLTFLNGAQSGAIFVDYTNKRTALGYFGPDGVTTTSKVWQFFDKLVQYNYNDQSEACTKSDLNLTITPAFNWVHTATLLASSTDTNIWGSTTSPGHLVELGVGRNSSQKPSFLLWRDGTLTAEMRFLIFTSGQPDASVFTLPLACVE
jgi:hypothetical protein